MTKRMAAAAVLALALLATPGFARAGVHVSFGFGLPFPFFGVVAPAPVYVPPPVYYPPAVTYAPAYYPYYPYYGGRVGVWDRHHRGWHGRHWSRY